MNRQVFTTFLIAFLSIFIYAILRYVVIKGDSVEHIPLYITNKAFATTSVFLIGLSFGLGPLAKFWPEMFKKHVYLRKYFGLFGFGIAALHAFTTLLMFTPKYYPKLFDKEAVLTGQGELSMFFGILALFVFSGVAVTSLPSIEEKMDKKQWLFVQRIGYGAYFFVMLHLVFMSFRGWLNPKTWPGGLLPISLISFLIILLVFLIRIFAIFSQKEK